MRLRVSRVLAVVSLLACCADRLAHAQEAGSQPAPETAPAVATIPVKDQPAAPTKAVEQPSASDATRLDTIEVTANKRIKSQRDIPGSVNALRGEELEKINAQGMSDYLKRIPGVSLPENEPDQKVPIIRGIIAEVGLDGLSQLPTGIYADDMPFTDVALPVVVPDMNPFDLERVEVLKGPQGTLYGSGALAGLIHYILQKPKPLVWEGKLQTTLSSTQESASPSWNTGAAINIPLFGETVALRAVGVYLHNAGLYDQRADPDSAIPKDLNKTDYDSSRQTSGRLLAAWQVNERLKLSGLYFLQNTRVDDTGQADNREQPVRDPQPFPFPQKTGFSGANISAVYDFDFGTLLSSSNRITKKGRFTGAQALIGSRVQENPSDQVDPQNPTFPSGNGTGDIGPEDQNQVKLGSFSNADVSGYAQEFRLSSPLGTDSDWEWLAGAAYQGFRNSNISVSNGLPVPDTADGVFPITTPSGTLHGSHNFDIAYVAYDLKSREYALFGEATRRLGEYWEVTAGARIFQQSLTGKSLLYGLAGNALSGNIENIQVTDYVERGVTPRFSLRYKHNRNLQIYALASKGYQFGGVQLIPATIALKTIAQTNSGQSNNLSGFANYRSSDLWNYELGLRTEWLDRRLRFDLTGFYLKWQDLQLTTEVRTNQTGVEEQTINLTTPVVGNVGQAHSEGAEASFEVAPFSGAAFTSSAAWINAVTDVVFHTADGDFPAGTRLPGSPHFQWSNVFSYNHALPYFNSIEGSLSLTHTHTGEYFSNIQTTDSAGAYDTVDANLGLRKPETVWLPELTFNAINLTDVRGISNATHTFFDRRKNFLFVRPRTLILTLGWRI